MDNATKSFLLSVLSENNNLITTNQPIPSQPMQIGQAGIKKPKPFEIKSLQGFTVTPEQQQQITNLLSQESDDPRTEEIEEPTGKTDWQTLVKTSQNAILRSTDELLKKYGLKF